MHVMRLRERSPIMFILLTILLCLAQIFLPDAAQLAAGLQAQAIVLSLGVFTFLLCRPWFNHRSHRPLDCAGKAHP
jgi:hypothetical protein